MGALFLEANAGVLGDPVPQWLDILLTAFAWVWLVNLNFMDGIDGISGVETGAIGLGFAGLAALNLAPAALLPLGLAMTAAAIGFLFGTGARRASSWAMSAVCRSAISPASWSCPLPRSSPSAPARGSRP